MLHVLLELPQYPVTTDGHVPLLQYHPDVGFVPGSQVHPLQIGALIVPSPQDTLQLPAVQVHVYVMQSDTIAPTFVAWALN